jgi:hypothetical protein
MQQLYGISISFQTEVMVAFTLSFYKIALFNLLLPGLQARKSITSKDISRQIVTYKQIDSMEIYLWRLSKRDRRYCWSF